MNLFNGVEEYNDYKKALCNAACRYDAAGSRCLRQLRRR